MLKLGALILAKQSYVTVILFIPKSVAMKFNYRLLASTYFNKTTRWNDYKVNFVL